MKREVVTFYRFTAMTDLHGLRATWLQRAQAADIRGTIILAAEGLNGTLVGETAQLGTFLDGLRQLPGLADLAVKRSEAAEDNPVFLRFKVKIKPEIVTMGVPSVDVAQQTGQHVDYRAWHQLLDDPDVRVIDTRNTYECAVGTFARAEQPDTRHFRDFPAYAEQHLLDDPPKRVAMFCTGGIRCEKASAYLLSRGVEEVYQLGRWGFTVSRRRAGGGKPLAG